MYRLADYFHVPHELIGCITSMLLSSAALIGTAIQAIVPTPDVTGEWPLYGVLITAIVALFLSLGYLLRWVATRWLAQQEATNKVIIESTNATKKQTEVLEKQVEWFEEFGKNALKLQLDTARLSVHNLQSQQPNPPSA